MILFIFLFFASVFHTGHRTERPPTITLNGTAVRHKTADRFLRCLILWPIFSVTSLLLMVLF